MLKNERGMALVMVLVLSVIMLATMAALVYMVTTSTQVSGVQKHYRTAQDAARGGVDIIYQIIGTKGDPAARAALLTSLNNLTLWSTVTTNTTCGGVSRDGTALTGFDAKLGSPSTSWTTGCNTSLVINTTNNTTYDFSADVGVGTTYRVFGKVVNTVEGNSGGELGLVKNGVVNAQGGEAAAMSMPYLYTIEVDAESTTNSKERAKYSILYEY